ncbi:MAG: ATP-binding cassette domain-containing protein [Kiritimatiellia bacterium]
MPGKSSPFIISCEHLFVAYGRQEVLRDVCIDILPGVLLPFVGPNGAGKTTLLRAILGLLKPSRGRIRTPFARMPPGYVPQQKTIDPLYPVTIRQIVEMGLFPQLGWWRQPDGGHKRLVDAALARFGLAEHQGKMFGELSGGMKQKAILGRAFVSGADVFVMDEPTSELDEDSEREVLAHLLALCREDGKTVLLAHHGIEQAGSLSPIVCVVNQGHVEMADIARAQQLLAGTTSGAGLTPFVEGIRPL